MRNIRFSPCTKTGFGPLILLSTCMYSTLSNARRVPLRLFSVIVLYYAIPPELILFMLVMNTTIAFLRAMTSYLQGKKLRCLPTSGNVIYHLKERALSYHKILKTIRILRRNYSQVEECIQTGTCWLVWSHDIFSFGHKCLCIQMKLFNGRFKPHFTS